MCQELWKRTSSGGSYIRQGTQGILAWIDGSSALRAAPGCSPEVARLLDPPYIPVLNQNSGAVGKVGHSDWTGQALPGGWSGGRLFTREPGALSLKTGHRGEQVSYLIQGVPRQGCGGNSTWTGPRLTSGRGLVMGIKDLADRYQYPLG